MAENETRMSMGGFVALCLALLAVVLSLAAGCVSSIEVISMPQAVRTAYEIEQAGYDLDDMRAARMAAEADKLEAEARAITRNSVVENIGTVIVTIAIAVFVLLFIAAAIKLISGAFGIGGRDA